MTPWVLGGMVALAAGSAYAEKQSAPAYSRIPPEYYQQVYNAVADLLEADGYDDGSFGPVLVRLAWHAAGTYDAASGTGGSNGATMRFKAEAAWGANAGLAVARDRLQAVKNTFPEISYSDLWSLAGVVAIQEMGGPIIPWRPGRQDATEERTPPDGRLPDASKKGDHLRTVFRRMGFDDREIVALAGAHALGRCHKGRSGYDGPWTRAPTTFSNDYFVRLVEEKWVPKAWSGPLQYVNAAGGDLMMLPADLALLEDAAFATHVRAYAADGELFFRDFAAAFRKLEELGVPFKRDAPVITFARRA